MTVAFEVGALVAARGREWVVLPGSEPPDFLVLRPLGGADAEIAGVFPDLEDVRTAEFPAPEPQDAGNATTAGLLRTALRIGFRSSAGPFRSIANIAVEPRPYQLVPLLMALRQETVRMLIADDVGIGKTVEAGLIAAELLAQGDARHVAVLCSPALAEQWQGELASKFGIQAELVLPGTITRLERGLMGDSVFDRNVIISTDFIKRPGMREQLWQSCPDLLIVDEAHTCVSDGTATRSRMLRHELVKRLASNSKRHLLLVTATPHSGKDAGFRNLLALLDPSLGDVDLDQSAERSRLAMHFVQRRRANIRTYLDEQTPFPEDRLSQERPYKLSSAYRDLFDDVLAYAREIVQDSSGKGVRQRVRYWSALALLRALASSPRAAAATLATRSGAVEADDEDEADTLGRAAVLDLPDEVSQESADMTPGADSEPTSEDTAHRRRLRRFAQRAYALEGQQDTKLAEVTQVVADLLVDGYNPVVFCRFIDTAEYIADHLRRELGEGYAVAEVTGALPPEERQARIAELVANPELRPVLVATDCLSEGINLQAHFQAVVHYDLAWNPTRHEQREGRVDRFGQRAPVVRTVLLYGTDNGIDGIVLRVLLRKHEQIRKALGISVPVPDNSDNVIEAILEGVLLREPDQEQLAFDLFGQEKRDELHLEWDSAVEREKASRAKYAQEAIKPAEVARELAEIRANLGSVQETAQFVSESLQALGSDLTEQFDGFAATSLSLPTALTDALVPGHAEPLPFRSELPVPPGEARLDRTDPNVAAIARYVLESALDTTLPDRLRPARRCGVMRTTAVDKRTTLLLVRFRMQIELPGMAEAKQSVAEEAGIVAYRGRADAAEWLPQDQVAELLSAVPNANVPPDQATEFLVRAIDGLDKIKPHLESQGEALAGRLRQAHIRVRESAGQRARRRIAVTPQRSVDVLGVYVYLPGDAQ